MTGESLIPVQRLMRPVHVIGAASAEGVAVARLLERLGAREIVMHDMREREAIRTAFRTTHGAYSRVEQDALWDAIRPMIDAGRYGVDYLTGIAAGDTIVLGQGWYLVPDNRERVRRVLDTTDDIFVTSMTELYVDLAPGPIVAVTGTNGKSTTVALVDELMDAAPVAHRTAGNERSSRQFLHELPDMALGTIVLLEISNRQLAQVARIAPRVASITSLTPDHLDEHDGWEGYVAVKRSLFASQEPGDVAILNDDDPECRRAVEGSVAQVVACGIGERPAPSVCWIGDDLVATDVPVVIGPRAGTTISGRIAGRRDLRVPGDHNRRNVAVAVAVALSSGVHADLVVGVLSGFTGKSLRLEVLGTVDGVLVISDIKSTTPEAAVAALGSLDDLAPDHGAIHLIAGGDDKSLDYSTLAESIAGSGVQTYLVPGSASDRLATALAQAKAIEPVRMERLADIIDAVFAAATTGDVMIVSPAAAGFWTTQLQGARSLRSLIRDHASARGTHTKEVRST